MERYSTTNGVNLNFSPDLDQLEVTVEGIRLSSVATWSHL